MVLTLYEVLNDQPIFIPKDYEYNSKFEAFKVLDTARFINVNRLIKIQSMDTRIIESYFATLTSRLNLTEDSPELQKLRDWKDFVLKEYLTVPVDFYCSSAEYQLGNYETIYVHISYATNQVAFFIPGCAFHLWVSALGAMRIES